MPLFRELLQPSSRSPVPVQTPSHSENGIVRSTLPTQPITGQPGAIENIQISNNQSCPPGLKPLNEIDQLLVHQGTDVLEAVTGFESANKYTIKNSKGETIFWGAEESDCCERQMCGQNRSFTMNIYNNHNQEVIHLYRDLACGGCCCITENMQVSAPTGNVIGSVEQEFTIMTPKFYIKNETGEIVLTIKGQAIPVSLGGIVEFQVYSRDGQTEIGKITKQWGGLMREVATNSDNFGLTFPLDLNVKYKAILLGMCFLIDFVYFENR